ncbi:MAG: hypothetical protein AVDCRST_MAG86-2342 [uncultured Truepera sp.]|uniref:Uncharacterized protein n=1 Tax=uncultured Truepera sp. TaxID=543023 RepID=A0A6J4VL17_9DEIN|nr:MAG: hypothetical protein AVDCRST_MAG86-2342 [uncultured Truepera sp.]
MPKREASPQKQQDKRLQTGCKARLNRAPYYAARLSLT